VWAIIEIQIERFTKVNFRRIYEKREQLSYESC
jgi:hypothetical protein